MAVILKGQFTRLVKWRP